jgi:hypothetical protein
VLIHIQLPLGKVQQLLKQIEILDPWEASGVVEICSPTSSLFLLCTPGTWAFPVRSLKLIPVHALIVDTHQVRVCCHQLLKRLLQVGQPGLRVKTLTVHSANAHTGEGVHRNSSSSTGHFCHKRGGATLISPFQQKGASHQKELINITGFPKDSEKHTIN